jgi:hypothetical protein
MDQTSPAFLEVEIEHHPMAILYQFFKPTIEINGVKEKRKWGTHQFRLQPGNYLVSISYPWIFEPECGKNSVEFTITAGEKRKIKYRAPAIRYVPGKISIR